jgi:hypothetical protein
MRLGTRKVASIIGIFAGLSGASHGLGEMLQGIVAPSGLFIKAWPGLTALNGEPAMTIIPNFLVAGILTMIVGVMLAIWAGRFMQSSHGPVITVMLSAAMLLVGGGIFPPIIGFVAAIIGTSWAAELAERRQGIAFLTLLSFLVPLSVMMLFGFLGVEA